MHILQRLRHVLSSSATRAGPTKGAGLKRGKAYRQAQSALPARRGLEAASMRALFLHLTPGEHRGHTPLKHWVSRPAAAARHCSASRQQRRERGAPGQRRRNMAEGATNAQDQGPGTWPCDKGADHECGVHVRSRGFRFRGGCAGEGGGTPQPRADKPERLPQYTPNLSGGRRSAGRNRIERKRDDYRERAHGGRVAADEMQPLGSSCGKRRDYNILRAQSSRKFAHQNDPFIVSEGGPRRELEEEMHYVSGKI